MDQVSTSKALDKQSKLDALFAIAMLANYHKYETQNQYCVQIKETNVCLLKMYEMNTNGNN